MTTNAIQYKKAFRKRLNEYLETEPNILTNTKESNDYFTIKRGRSIYKRINIKQRELSFKMTTNIRNTYNMKLPNYTRKPFLKQDIQNSVNQRFTSTYEQTVSKESVFVAPGSDKK